ncbi:carbon monoxide dehydrogenase subunit G [Kaistia dalseonensis]|uniref:Carbon monoxide dehydrogenase subunit G n=1 Tax=Kaistia dalseonensis TaxID=410840 RepID=A0ABU0H9D6_9HYPH|nr:carbon monoxide dehydrogenase subunit G [Kaistia dalseonensis]MCX5496320.1 carbon monoxide dehydrogenase subunit G [Kaistia dalseonensis]MDQ0438939.1 carbon monoxide dehydrogenase subunit G [Kaistia dalseonensis]
MDMTGEYRIAARREAVWAALNDPEFLKACIAGCESLTLTSSTSMAGRIAVDIGPMKGVFAGTVVLSNVNPPESATISGEADGGSAGRVRGGADVTLADDDGGTMLRYAIRTQVGGHLAQLGSRRIDTTARTMADDFFGAFAAKLGAEEPTVTAPPLATPTPGGEEAAEDELIDRLEHRVEDYAEDVAEAAEEAEQEVEVAAGRGFLGGPYVWGLLVILIGLAVIVLMR